MEKTSSGLKEMVEAKNNRNAEERAIIMSASHLTRSTFRSFKSFSIDSISVSLISEVDAL